LPVKWHRMRKKMERQLNRKFGITKLNINLA
jgi:hypothetical protein